MKKYAYPEFSHQDFLKLIENHPLGRPLIGVLFYNNGESGRMLVDRFPDWPDEDVLFHDDGSTDGTAEVLKSQCYQVICQEMNNGLGKAIKTVIRHAHDTGRKVVVIMAGNNKDDPDQIYRLLLPIYMDNVDYVQGSRRLAGGSSENIPAFRKLMVPVHALMMSVLTGVWCTDALNGFRAYKTSLFYDNPRMNIWQDWLDHYELETYIHYNVLRGGYRTTEVPVSKSYAHFNNGARYSHIRPFSDWWSILRPLVYLRLGLRK
jgi:dolichol-phosphate mannosyltransferase